MLLDEVMPTYHFNVVASISIQAPPGRIFRVIRETRPSDIPLFSALFWIRELPGRLTRRGTRYFPSPQTLLEQGFTRLGFLLLGEEPEREIVFGAVGRWWIPWGADFYHLAGAGDFLQFDHPGYAKAAGNFYTMADPLTGSTTVRHETRVYAVDAGTRTKFAVYWRIVYPGVALIRRMWLRSIKHRAEAVSVS
jgi:hypothetical protein